MLTVLGGIILGAAAGVLAGMIISFVVLGISHLLNRIKRWHKGKVAIADAKDAIAKAIQEETKKNGRKGISPNEIEKWNEMEEVLGANSVIEAHIDENGKVDPKDLNILKPDRREEPLERFLKANEGFAVVTCE